MPARESALASSVKTAPQAAQRRPWQAAGGSIALPAREHFDVAGMHRKVQDETISDAALVADPRNKLKECDTSNSFAL